MFARRISIVSKVCAVRLQCPDAPMDRKLCSDVQEQGKRIVPRDMFAIVSAMLMLILYSMVCISAQCRGQNVTKANFEAATENICHTYQYNNFIKLENCKIDNTTQKMIPLYIKLNF